MAANSLIKEAHIQDIQTQTMHQIYGTINDSTVELSCLYCIAIDNFMVELPCLYSIAKIWINKLVPS